MAHIVEWDTVVSAKSIGYLLNRVINILQTRKYILRWKPRSRREKNTNGYEI